MKGFTRATHLAIACGFAVLLSSCRKQDMADQPKKDPLEESAFFADGQASRPLIEGTVPRGGHTVRADVFAVSNPGVPEATSFPFQLTRVDLERGRQQFDIYCATCHGRLGDGNGMIAQRGFVHPPSFYLDRLRNAPPGHFFNVITYGYGAMYSYNERVSSDDRWRIAGYIRALQLSDPTNKGTQPTTQPR